jgi:hypothetical protein
MLQCGRCPGSFRHCYPNNNAIQQRHAYPFAAPAAVAGGLPEESDLLHRPRMAGHLLAILAGRFLFVAYKCQQI